MLISGRKVLLGLSLLITAMGVAMLLDVSARPWGAAIVVAGLVSSIVLVRLRPPSSPRHEEPADIRELDDQRCRELIRGTSLFLREMRYRYSVRFDRSDRARFTMTVNTVCLGFVPVVINDNLSERQGYGYVAFVYDERRWRGPGLPCAGGPEQAVQYAAQCITPLDDRDGRGDESGADGGGDGGADSRDDDDGDEAWR